MWIIKCKCKLFWKCILLFSVIFILIERVQGGKVVFASERTFSSEEIEQEVESSVLDNIDIKDIEDIMGDIFIEEKIGFSDLLEVVLQGEFEQINEVAYQYVVKQFFYEIQYNRQTLIHILLLTIFSAIFAYFANSFGNEQIAVIGGYILYLMILIVTLQSFQVVIQDVTAKVDQVLMFMSALCPVYFLTVAISCGTNSAVVFYNLALLCIYLVEVLILWLVIPMTNTYILVQVLNYMTLEKRFSKLADLIKTVIDWLLKAMVIFVVGLNVIQGLLAPVADSVERSIWLRGAEAIPVVGDAVSGTGEVVIGTLKLIKNSVGIVGLLLCIAIMIGPAIEMIILTLMYKFIAALIEPVADQKVSSCLYSVGEGCQILLRIVFGVGLLFLITIAVVAATT